jgi:hypothetical protein
MNLKARINLLFTFFGITNKSVGSIYLIIELLSENECVIDENVNSLKQFCI